MNKNKLFKKYFWESLLLASNIVLTVLAAAHSLSLTSPAYKNSPIITLEFLLITLILILLFISTFRLIMALMKKDSSFWYKLVLLMINFSLTILAIYLDKATLLYMT